MEKTIKQENTFDIKVGTIKSKESGVEYITIHQDGVTHFLEKSKIVEFLKTVNTFK